MATSMRLAEDEREGDDKEFIALVVANVQDPVAPVFKAKLISERVHDASRVITGLFETVYNGATSIDENLLRARTVKIDLGHVELLQQNGLPKITAADVVAVTLTAEWKMLA
ncbi:hypothetical protein AC628_07075 [Bradyrhizobium sp. NAS96.2]|nr:hypothetical protein AC628_07075 [Bradyrhizobium sp. NAS96.2]